MSHFAKIENNRVTQVIVAEQDFIDTLEGTWIQTSYNTYGGVHYGQDGNPDGGIALRYNYASIGGHYDSETDAFYEEQPFSSWTLNTTTYTWQPPTPYPNDGNDYKWDETTDSWQQATLIVPE